MKKPKAKTKGPVTYEVYGYWLSKIDASQLVRTLMGTTDQECYAQAIVAGLSMACPSQWFGLATCKDGIREFSKPIHYVLQEIEVTKS